MEFFKKRKQETEEELQKRISELAPELQAQFLWATDVLLQKESSLFLDVIQESRNDIKEISHEIRREKSTFRANVNRLEKYDDGKISSTKLATDKLNEFVEKRQKNKKNITMNYQPDQEKEAVENYLKAVGRHRENDGSSRSEIPSYANLATFGSTNTRPDSAYKIRIDDNEPLTYLNSPENTYIEPIIINVDPSINRQQEELINRMKEQDNQAALERDRQKKIMEKKMADRQNKRIDSAGVRAAGMIDQSRGVDEKQLQNKLQQEKSILERLEKMKVNRNSSPINERSSSTLSSKVLGSKSSLFEDNNQKLATRPQTGESKSPSKTIESIELRTPIKSGWNESTSQKNIAAMFEVNDEFPQQEIKERKKKKKKHRKNKDQPETPIESKDDIEIINFED